MTQRTQVTGNLDSVNSNRFGQYVVILTSCDNGPPIQTFLQTEKKALAIANGDEDFPIGIRVKVNGRYDDKDAENTSKVRKVTHARIVSVDGVEVTAWAQRVGSITQDPNALSAAQKRIKEAEEAEKVMTNRAPPEQPGAITDPVVAYENAMRIVRRQRRLKEPKLSQQEIWQVRDALNLMAEKLGID